MSFVESIKSCFSNYVGFSGRARRSEYWYFQLFLGLVVTLPVLIVPLLSLAIFAVLFLPALAVTIRRLHDIDKSGWNVLLYYIPFVGFVLLLIWFCRKGTEGDNHFGPDPLIHGPATSAASSTANTIIAKSERLARLKTLLDSGSIAQDEFDKTNSTR